MASPTERADKVRAVMKKPPGFRWSALKLIPSGSLIITPEDIAAGYVLLTPEQAGEVDADFKRRADLADRRGRLAARYREAIEHVVSDSPGTPEAVKQYLRKALAGVPGKDSAACDGSADCQATVHIDGCFSDRPGKDSDT